MPRIKVPFNEAPCTMVYLALYHSFLKPIKQPLTSVSGILACSVVSGKVKVVPVIN